MCISAERLDHCLLQQQRQQAHFATLAGLGQGWTHIHVSIVILYQQSASNSMVTSSQESIAQCNILQARANAEGSSTPSFGPCATGPVNIAAQ